MPRTTTEGLRRLIAVDAALAGKGLCRTVLAENWRVSHRTIQRDHELLRAITGDPGVYQQAEDGTYLWWYSDRRRRVFTRWMTKRNKGR
jgi:hypothetical protein